MTHAWRTIGIIGGMGPLASADFLSRLILASGCERDADYPRLLLDSNPFIPDRNAARSGGPSPGPALAATARRLVLQGAEVIAMPCNAAHGWADEIRAATDAVFVNMIDATVARVMTNGPRCVGVLGVAATLDARLYHAPLEAQGIAVVTPDAAAFAACIAAVKAGRHDAATRATMAGIAAALVEAGADVLIAACTEVPLLLDGAAAARLDTAPPFIDATAALVAATLAAAQRGDAPQL